MGNGLCFVLGAGASMPYGYPSANTLRQDLLNRKKRLVSDDLKVMRLAHEQIDYFFEVLGDCNVPSVDEMLEHHPDLADVGKLAIASALLSYEHESQLADDPNRPERWYSHIWKQVRDRVQSERALPSKIAVITFNYDLSLDEFLCRGINTLYKNKPEYRARSLGIVSIVHVHGSLGPHAMHQREGRPYNGLRTPESIKACAQSLRLAHEPGFDASFEDAHVAICSADLVCFLGFGFHEQNIRRITPEDKPKKVQHVVSTSVGLEPGQKDRIVKFVGARFGRPLTFLEGDSTRAIQNLPILNDYPTPTARVGTPRRSPRHQWP